MSSKVCRYCSDEKDEFHNETDCRWNLDLVMREDGVEEAFRLFPTGSAGMFKSSLGRVLKELGVR